jgi:hypothetical protein
MSFWRFMVSISISIYREDRHIMVKKIRYVSSIMLGTQRSYRAKWTLVDSYEFHYH